MTRFLLVAAGVGYVIAVSLVLFSVLAPGASPGCLLLAEIPLLFFVLGIGGTRIQRAMRDRPTGQHYKLMYAGCPGWMRRFSQGSMLAAALLILTGILLSGGGSSASGDGEAAFLFGAFGVFIFGGLFGQIYSADRLAVVAPIRECRNGHPGSPGGRFCEECGERLDNDSGSELTAGESPGRDGVNKVAPLRLADELTAVAESEPGGRRKAVVRIFLLVFAALAVVGFVLSLWTHVAAHLGHDGPLGEYPFVLHFGVFLVWFPAVLAGNALAAESTQRDFMKAALRGVPRWTRVAVSGLMTYFVVSLVIAAMSGASGDDGASRSEELANVIGFSSGWMVFYGAAAAILRSAARVTLSASSRHCRSGHRMRPVADYCSECGQPWMEDGRVEPI